jgi:hypothetical protein
MPASGREHQIFNSERLMEEQGFTGEGLRAVGGVVRPRDVRSSDACAGRSTSGRSAGGDCRRGAEGALLDRAPAAL